MTENVTLNYNEPILKPSKKVLDFIFGYAASYDAMKTEMLGLTGFMKN